MNFFILSDIDPIISDKPNSVLLMSYSLFAQISIKKIYAKIFFLIFLYFLMLSHPCSKRIMIFQIYLET